MTSLSPKLPVRAVRRSFSRVSKAPTGATSDVCRDGPLFRPSISPPRSLTGGCRGRLYNTDRSYVQTSASPGQFGTRPPTGHHSHHGGHPFIESNHRRVRVGGGGDRTNEMRCTDRIELDVGVQELMENIKLACSLNDVAWVKRLLSMGMRNPKVDRLLMFNRVLKSIAMEGLAVSPHHLVSYMWGEAGVRSHVWSYNWIILALTKSGQFSEALEAFEAMQSKGHLPNVVTYNFVLKACKEGKFEKEAIEIWKAMRERGTVRPSIHVYTTMMGIFAQSRMWKEALYLMEEMRSYHVLPDRLSFDMAIRACANAGKWEQALELFEEMQRLGIPLNRYSYNTMFHAFEEGDQWELALDLLDRMRAGEIGPDAVSYNTVMKACGKCGEWGEVDKLFARAKKDGIRHTAVTYNIAMDAHRAMDDPEKVMMLLNKMKDVGIVPTVISYNIAISASVGDWKVAMDLFDEMQRNGVQPDDYTFNAAINACGRCGELDRVLELFAQMQTAGVAPNAVTYNSMIHACGMKDELKMAFRVLGQMRESGCVPDLVTYNTIMNASAAVGEWELLMDVLKNMQAEGITPDVYTYDTMRESCPDDDKSWAEAASVFREMRILKQLEASAVDKIEKSLWPTKQ